MYILWVFRCFLKESLITSEGLNDVIKKVQRDYFKSGGKVKEMKGFNSLAL